MSDWKQEFQKRYGADKSKQAETESEQEKFIRLAKEMRNVPLMRIKPPCGSCSKVK